MMDGACIAPEPKIVEMPEGARTSCGYSPVDKEGLESTCATIPTHAQGEGTHQHECNGESPACRLPTSQSPLNW